MHINYTKLHINIVHIFTRKKLMRIIRLKKNKDCTVYIYNIYNI